MRSLRAETGHAAPCQQFEKCTQNAYGQLHTNNNNNDKRNQMARPTNWIEAREAFMQSFDEVVRDAGTPATSALYALVDDVAAFETQFRQNHDSAPTAHFNASEWFLSCICALLAHSLDSFEVLVHSFHDRNDGVSTENLIHIASIAALIGAHDYCEMALRHHRALVPLREQRRVSKVTNNTLMSSALFGALDPSRGTEHFWLARWIFEDFYHFDMTAFPTMSPVRRIVQHMSKHDWQVSVEDADQWMTRCSTRILSCLYHLCSGAGFLC